jgi:hypothetical protein
MTPEPTGMAKPDRVFLYDAPTCEGLDILAIAEYLRGLMPDAAVETRDEFVYHHAPGQALDRDPARVTDLAWDGTPSELLTSLPGRDAPEEDPADLGLGDLFDGFLLAGLYGDLLPRAEGSRRDVHVAFVDDLIGTFDASDARFHARVVAAGQPALISTVGAVEAPARPREFYFIRAQLMALGTASEADLEDLEEEFADRILVHGDARLTEVLKGYALQAVSYSLTGQAFCDDPTCRLLDAHWQEDMLAAQCAPEAGLCAECEQRLRSVLSGRLDVRV